MNNQNTPWVTANNPAQDADDIDPEEVSASIFRTLSAVDKLKNAGAAAQTGSSIAGDNVAANAAGAAGAAGGGGTY
jgi:hypothetical protein